MTDSGSDIDIAVIDPAAMAWLETSDLGNAKRFVMRAQNLLRWVPEWGWIAFDGQRWSRDDGDRLATLKAHEVARGLRDELAALANMDLDQVQAKFGKAINADILENRITLLNRHAVDSGNAGKTSGMMKQAANYLAARVEDFDPDPLAFNVTNGTLRIRHHQGQWRVKLFPHDPADMITRMANVAYDAKAAAPKWIERLETVQPDPVARHLLQVINGYCLTGLTSAQIWFLYQGRGGDGKSLTDDVISDIWGDYHARASILTFLDGGRKSGSDHSSDLARLQGDIRLVTAPEPDRGSAFNSSLLKQVTGGRLTVRALNRPETEYVPRWKLLIECNPLPRVSTSDDGFWRRVCLLPWVKQFKGGDRADFDQLKQALLGEAPGILNWAIEGALWWLENRRFPEPDQARDMLAEYRVSSDPLAEWLAERCDVSDASATEGSKALLADCKQWYEDSGHEFPPTQTKLGRWLQARQIGSVRGTGGAKLRKGIKLKPVDQFDADLASPAPVAARGADAAQGWAAQGPNGLYAAGDDWDDPFDE